MVGRPENIYRRILKIIFACHLNRLVQEKANNAERNSTKTNYDLVTSTADSKLSLYANAECQKLKQSTPNAILNQFFTRSKRSDIF